MKKIIAIILALILLAAPMTVLAHKDNANAGTVPKTATAPVIDGVRDAVYDEGLFLPVRNIHSGDGGLGGGSDAWLLWEDNFLYVFAQMDVKSFYLPDNFEELQIDVPWELTTFEIIIDFANAGGGHDVVSMVRADLTGYLTMHAASQSFLAVGGDCKKFVEFGFVRGSSSLAMEFKINMPEFRKAAEAEGLVFGSDFAAGKEIGLYMFSQEVAEDGDVARFISVPSDMAGNWIPDNYDYVVLGENLVGVPEPEPDPVVDTPEAGAGGGDAAPEPPPVQRPPSVNTGDSAMIFIALALAAAAAFIIAKRAIKTKA